MPKAMTKAAIVGLACLATVTAGTIAPTATAAPATVTTKVAPANKNSVTDFGYNATVFGTKVLLGGIEIRTLKDALINRPCTRRVGLESTEDSIISTNLLPDALRSIVDFSLSRSTTQTYREGAAYGVRGVNSLANLSLGGELLGQPTPRLVLKGLVSKADAFYNGQAARGKGSFGFRNSFGYEGLELQLTEDDPVSETLQTLFDILGVDPVEAVNEAVAVPLNALLQVIGSVPLVIPGLGEVALGQARGKKTANSADSEAYALKITLEEIPSLGIPATTLQLGRALAQVSRPVQFGVFRSKMSALEADLGGLLKLGGVGQRALPCHGTSKKVVTSRVGSAGIPEVLSISGVEYKYQGVQKGKAANGFVQTTIGKIKLLQANVVVEGLVARVGLKSAKPNQRVQSIPSVTIGRLLINGEEIKGLGFGKAIDFSDNTGQRGSLIMGYLDPAVDPFFGKHLSGLRIKLPGTNTGIDLGIANGEVFFR
ncbi:MAG: hypothetical protein WB767_09050 [Nocardioides sp.]